MYFGTCLFRSTQPWGMIDVCDFVLFFNDISFKTFLHVVPQCSKHLILSHVSDSSLQSGHKNPFWLMCHCWANKYDFTLINTKCACLMNGVGSQRSSLGNFSQKPSPQWGSCSLGTSYFFQSGLFCPASGLLKSDIPDNTYRHVVLVCAHCCGYAGLVSIVRMGALYRVMTLYRLMSFLFSLDLDGYMTLLLWSHCWFLHRGNPRLCERKPNWLYVQRSGI